MRFPERQRAVFLPRQNEWNESKHPREDDGKFGEGSGGGGAKDKGEADGVSEWGEAFSGFTGKPAEAIDHLMKEKRGYVPGAFHRDDLGPIDLPYGKSGKNGFGVAHIIERRNQQGYDGEAFVKGLPTLIKEGTLKDGDSENTKFIFHEQRKTVIKLDWLGKKKTWIVTAYNLK